MGRDFFAHFNILFHLINISSNLIGEGLMVDTSTNGEQPDTDSLPSADLVQKKNQKVQLDIEDAPFLLESEEDAVTAGKEVEEPNQSIITEPQAEQNEQDEALRKKKFRRQKVVVIILLVTLVAILGIWFFFFRTITPLQEPTLPEPTVVVVPAPESITGPKEYKFIFEPFTVAQVVGNSVKFLEASFVGISKNENVIKESQSKALVLRDAIYYYLGNKTHEFLIDPKNTAIVKQDLLDIVNGYLVSGKMEDMLLENYIVK